MFPVLKFGGTSVGSAQRIKDLVKLTVNGSPKVVVLSAMSGTTNALVEICAALYKKDSAMAMALIEQLREKYNQVIAELFTSTAGKIKARQLTDNHFNYLAGFTQDMFTVNEEK